MKPPKIQPKNAIDNIMVQYFPAKNHAGLTTHHTTHDEKLLFNASNEQNLTVRSGIHLSMGKDTLAQALGERWKETTHLT